MMRHCQRQDDRYCGVNFQYEKVSKTINADSGVGGRSISFGFGLARPAGDLCFLYEIPVPLSSISYLAEKIFSGTSHAVFPQTKIIRSFV